MQTWETDLLAELERLGEEEVRIKQLRTEFASIGDNRKYQFVENWLRSKRDARNELRAHRTTIIAIIAITLSASAIIIQIMQWASKP